MEFRPDSSIEVSPGDFASRVDGSELLIPVILANLAWSQHLSTAEELAGYVEAFPSSVGASLGWGSSAVQTAARRLNDQLSQAGFQPSGARQRRIYGLG